MTHTAATLSPAAADVLRRATADTCSVTLPPGQLPRPVYEEVNRVLTRIAGGGRWNRKAKAHLFTEDPRPELAALLGDGGEVAMPVDRDKLLSYWSTPPSVARQMCALAFTGRDRSRNVLEPSAGDGALARVILEGRPALHLTCVEIDERRATKCCQVVGDDDHVFDMDFRDFAGPGSPAVYDTVVMNPPFTEEGNPTAWVDHIDLALGLLVRGGRLVSVVPGSWGFRDHKKIAALRDRVAGHASTTWLSDGSFDPSGTGVRTGLLTVTP